MLRPALQDRGTFGSGLAGRLRRLVHGRDGVAMLEFALIVPFLVFLLLGAMEIGRFMLLNQKLGRAAINTSDLVSQAKFAVEADIEQVFAAAEFTMSPFALGTDGVIFITSVSTDGSDPITPTISWQMSGAGTGAYPSAVGSGVGTTANLPVGFAMEENQNIIIAEVIYNYQPFLFGRVITPQEIRQTGLHRPRLRPLHELVTP